MPTDPQRPDAPVTEEHLAWALKLQDRLSASYAADPSKDYWLVVTAQFIANHDAQVEPRARLAEAKWWADPNRQNGPKTLYPNEQERIAQHEAALGEKQG